MAAGEVAHYLSTGTADYTATSFDVTPDDVLIEEGEFNQETIKYDDQSVAVYSKSSIPEFYFNLKWDVLEDADSNTIFDFYFDANKGNGKARTFEFPHPTDGYTYIVRFWTKMTRSIRYYAEISGIKLKIEAVKAS